MFGLSLATTGFALLHFWKGATIVFAAHAALELLQEFTPVVLAVLIALGLYAARQQRRAKEMPDRLYWNAVHLGAGADALGYVLLFAATRMVIDRPWLDPSWTDVVVGIIAAAFATAAWRCFLAAASFFRDAFRPARND